jgi:hypothetical protein
VGISILNGLFLVEARATGARFDTTLTLGRMSSFLAPRDLQRLASALAEIDPLAKPAVSTAIPIDMDQFFVSLGAKRLDALDASNFEGAQLLHDLNEPLPESLRGGYDAVVDAGTLEHVFNVPTAFRNAMDAVKVGGHFFAALPANNMCGHGFYQFSAEFFYRVFCAENGFEVVKLLVAPIYAGGRWLDGPAFEVADPRKIGTRVNIYGRKQMIFLLQAKKLAQTAVFGRWPQQSDYSAAWTGAKQTTPLSSRSTTKGLKWLTGRLGALNGLGVRIYERWMWGRGSQANPALRLHRWTY